MEKPIYLCTHGEVIDGSRKKKRGGDALTVGSFYVLLLSRPYQMSMRVNNSVKSCKTGRIKIIQSSRPLLFFVKIL